MDCQDLKITLIVWVFFSFYTTRRTNGIWVSLGGLSGKSLFASHLDHYKMDKFTCVRERECSLGVLGDDGAPSFL